MVKKNLAFAREVRAIGGVHALDKKKPATDGGSRPAARKERESPAANTNNPPAEVAPEDREEAPPSEEEAPEDGRWVRALICCEGGCCRKGSGEEALLRC